MELIAILFLVICAVLFLKLLAFFVQAGVFIITVPLKIIGFIVSMLLLFFVLIPAGVLSALASLVFVPITLLIILSPLLLIIFLLVLVLRRS